MPQSDPNVHVIISLDNTDVITVFPIDRADDTVQVWFEGTDGDCALAFDIKKWSELDAAVRARFKEVSDAANK